MIACAATDTTHAPTLECKNGDCDGAQSFPVNTSSGGRSSSGGASSAGAAGEVSLKGQIVEVGPPNFTVNEGLRAPGTFTVEVLGADNKPLSSDVSSSFTLDGVRYGKSLWFTAAPQGTTELLPALAALDTTTTTSVVVPVIPESALQAVGWVLTTPVTLDSDRAQVVLRFVDEAGMPLPDVTVSTTGAENIAYDAGSTYDDTWGATSNLGLAFLLNVDASATPSAKLVVLSGAVSAQFAVWVQAGSATALELVVSTD
jgi:hypothetical protein